MLRLAVPGIDELIGLVEIVRLSAGFEEVVVDTAPTGHALRLLTAPQAVQSLVRVLDALQRDHRIVRKHLARVDRPEAADRLIAALEQDATDARELLVDRTRTRFHWVTLPEPLAVAETADARRALAEIGVTVDELVVNRVTRPGPRCRVCDARRKTEADEIAAIRRIARGVRVRLIFAESEEPRGPSGLRRISIALRQSERSAAAGRRPRQRLRPATLVNSAKPLAAEDLRGKRLVFCGGKGGVGKTTVAAALSLRLARDSPGKRFLLLSTDPAHSLADVLAADASDVPRAMDGAPPNLHVRELDAPAALASRRASVDASLRALADAAGGSDPATDVGRGLTELVDLAPPGIDELLALLSVLEARQTYDAVVIDTAPTGHALRLLEMPALAREWVQALLRVLLKYRQIVRPGELAENLVELSRQIGALQDLLRDRAATHFIAVARAAELPRLETARLLARLRRLRLPAPVVVVNALTATPGACPRCRADLRAERREMVRFGSLCRKYRCDIIHAPLAVPPPRGIVGLEAWGQTWIG
jgi:arsenite-transporting ATPase